MASNGTVAHRFANKDYNEKRGLKGSSTHISGKNYYSYSTVFGQWVDEKVCLIYNGSTSVTSSKHQLCGSDFPKDVTLLPYDDGGYGYYHGCNLMGYSNDFNLDKRFELVDYYVQEMFDALKTLTTTKKKDMDSWAESMISEYYGYICKLCSLYKDTTINKWLKTKETGEDLGKKKKMLKFIKDGDAIVVSEILDHVFGKGSWERYEATQTSFRKADATKKRLLMLCDRLGISNPYRHGWFSGWMVSMSPDDVRKLTAKERNEVHFGTIYAKEHYDKREEREAKKLKNEVNAYEWITGFVPKMKINWCNRVCGYEKDVRECYNMFTHEYYSLGDGHIDFSVYDMKQEVEFDYNAFATAPDKNAWLNEFYAKCAEVDRNLKALAILNRIGDGCYTKQQIGFSSYKIFVINELVENNTTPEEFALCDDFVARWNVVLNDKVARERMERMRKEQERREKEQEELRLKQVKQEQIDECMSRGLDGCRDLWRNHLTTLWYAKDAANEIVYDKSEDFYYGGNVLLRFNLNKDKVETSKDIRIPVEVCKKMWGIVSKWHENPASFKPMTIDTKGSGTYIISSYKNDILTAGCHDISYTEMERMYNEIVNAA